MNPWAIQSFGIALFNLILGIYTLRKGLKRPLNRVFSLFAFSLAIWGISEFGHRTAESYKVAYLWIKGGGIGWCFMASLYLHFTLILTKHESLLKRKFTYVFMYLPPIGFLCLFLLTGLIYEQQIVNTEWGFTAPPGKFAWTFFLYYFLIYILTIYYITFIRRKGTTLAQKQTRPILFGTTVFVVTATVTNIAFPVFEIRAPEVGSSSSIILTLCTVYAILRHKLFIIEPRLEEIEETNRKYILERGLSYIIEEEKLDKSYDIFIDQLSHGGFGLCLSKLHPRKVRDTYGLARTPIVWVTFEENENTVSPRDVDAIESVIYDFLGQAERPVILIDCLNEIRLANGIAKTVNWLQRIKDTCREKDCILLISVNPEILDEEELAMIERRAEEEE